MSWLKDYFSNWLSEFLTDKGPQYVDLDYSVSTVQQGKLEWQAVASIGFHIAIFYLDSNPTDAERTLIQSIESSIAESLQAFIQDEVTEPDDESSRENRARTLFYARFALGELQKVRGDIERSIDILAEVVLTKATSEERREKSSGEVYKTITYMERPGRVFHSVDIIFAKILASYNVVPWLINKGNYQRAIYLLTEAGRGGPLILTLNLISAWVDAWIKQCKEANDLGQWVDLMDRVADIISISDGEEGTEQLRSSPSECELTSAVYWAWKFGQIVANLHIYGNIENMVESLMEDYYPSLTEWKNGLVFVSLWSECDEKRDWEIARAFYHEMWERTANYYADKLFEEGPESGLYWAMRIGLADAFLESGMTPDRFARTMQPQALTDIQGVLDKALPTQQSMDQVLQQLEDAKQEFDQPVSIRDLKERRETEDRLGRDYFRDLWKVMKKKTQELLISAEVAWVHQDLGNMVNQIRRMLEVELPEIFPFLKPAIDRRDTHLILTRMKNDLLENKAVRASIHGLKIHSDDRRWVLGQLPKFLSDVIDARNFFDKDEHFPDRLSRRNRDMRDMGKSIHSGLLGIETQGVLPRLLRIKSASSLGK